MKLNLTCTAPAWAGLVFAFGAASSMAQAPKPPVHKPEQSQLNRLKQDERSKKELSEVIEQLREAAKRNEAADKELKRIEPKDLKDDPAKVVESMKDKLSPEDTAKLKAVLEKSKEVINSEEGKKAAEELKKKAAATIKPKSGPTTTPPEKFGPSTFDKVPAPTPIVPEAPTLKRRTPNFDVSGDAIVFPPGRDPSNPGRVLPPSDPRSRTYLVIGSAQIKTPNMVMDADRIEAIASAEGGGINPAAPARKPVKGKPGDPVQPGQGTDDGEKKAAPFDRVIATGRVNVVRMVNGEAQTGKGGSMIYDKKSGTMVLTDWPQAQYKGKVFIGNAKDSKIILVPDGQPRTENCRMQGFDEPASAAAPTAASAAPRARMVP